VALDFHEIEGLRLPLFRTVRSAGS
jgi:hypothetical protein